MQYIIYIYIYIYILSIERGSSRSHYVEESFWKSLWTCCLTDFWWSWVGTVSSNNSQTCSWLSEVLQRLKLSHDRFTSCFSHLLFLNNPTNPGCLDRVAGCCSLNRQHIAHYCTLLALSLCIGRLCFSLFRKMGYFQGGSKMFYWSLVL